MSLERYSKLELTLKNYLQGAKLFGALMAFNFAKNYHTGFRKDGVTPEFQHQIEIALYAITIRSELIDLEKTLICILLHDVEEDYDVDRSIILNTFGDVEDDIWRMTKTYRGAKKPAHVVFKDIGESPISSIAKGIDRINNQQTLSSGGFTREKQFIYIDETENFILPMLKEADKRFPQQHMAYMNVRFVLKSQVALIKAALEGTQVLSKVA